jgi:hypothetical protein
MTLFLVKEGGLLPNVVQRLTALAGSPEAAVAKESMSDRLLNAAVNIAETNPAIVERISGTIERIIARVLPEPRTTAPVRQPQARQLQPGPAPFQGGRVEPLAQAPQVVESYDAPGPIETLDPSIPEAEDQDIMDILEDLFTLLTSDDKLVVDHPTFQQLRREYPVKFNMALKIIATQPLDDIIEWIKDKSPLYTSMLENPRLGPYYRQRLSELQILCQTPRQPQPVPQVNNDNAQTNEPPQAS